MALNSVSQLHHGHSRCVHLLWRPLSLLGTEPGLCHSPRGSSPCRRRWCRWRPGSGATTNGPDTARGVVNATTNSPLVVVFTIQGEENYIHVGHSLSVYPQDLGMPTAFDNKVIALVGNDLASAVPIVFPADSWTRTAAFRASTQAFITGPAMYGAGPPAVLRSGPHAGGAADTDEIRVRRTLILPPTASVAVLAGICNGALHPERLLQHSHRPIVAGGVAADAALWAPVVEWWRGASTDTAAGTTQTAANMILDPSPVNFGRLMAWTNRTKAHMLRNAGVGGPGLTTAAFNQGVADLQGTMEANANARLAFERNRANRTFTDKHGDSLAQRLLLPDRSGRRRRPARDPPTPRQVGLQEPPLRHPEQPSRPACCRVGRAPHLCQRAHCDLQASG